MSKRPNPNPGSDEALALGCRCPVLDNGHGRRPPVPPGTYGGEHGAWYVALDCPLHSVADLNEGDD